MQTIRVEIQVDSSYPLLESDIKQAIEELYNPMGLGKHIEVTVIKIKESYD